MNLASGIIDGSPLLGAWSLRNAGAKGKRLGRPRVVVDARRIAALGAEGRSWREVCVELRLTEHCTARLL